MYKHFYSFIEKTSDRLGNMMIFASIRQGLLLAIPALLVGSFALLITSLPIEAYQNWCTNALGGRLMSVFNFIQGATLKSISLILVMTISYSYGKKRKVKHQAYISAMTVCAYIVYTGTESFDVFAPTGVFTAMIVAVGAPALFIWISNMRILHKGRSFSGGDREFKLSLSAITPTAIVLGIFSVFHVIVVDLLGNDVHLRIFSAPMETLFANMGCTLGSAVLFLFFMQLMWFMGIHGSNVLEYVATDIFEKGLSINQQLIAAGLPPTEILSKTFFDSMVVMGGCGSAICLLAAIFIGDRRGNLRSTGKAAAVPVFFNINEILVFGIPIVLNPVFFIPFLITPIVLLLISYGATAMELVPMVTAKAQWTTPVFLSGYTSTGSIAGSVLQLVNIAVGTAIYVPFVRMASDIKERSYGKELRSLVNSCKENEEKGLEMRLVTRGDSLQATAEIFLAEFHAALKLGEVKLFYQPLIGPDEKPIGGEALCRWEHPMLGFVYPPVLMRLAEEGGFAIEMGYRLIERAALDLKRLNENVDARQRVFVNVTAEQLNAPGFSEGISEILERTGANPKNLGLELTERTILADSKEVSETLRKLQKMGIKLSIDDFGMGHTSLLYLQNNDFDEVKLDGSLVKLIVKNENSRNIVASIVELSKSMNFSIVAEYVETGQQQDILRSLSADIIYQGYLYSPAVPYESFEEYVRTKGGK